MIYYVVFDYFATGEGNQMGVWIGHSVNKTTAIKNASRAFYKGKKDEATYYEVGYRVWSGDIDKTDFNEEIKRWASRCLDRLVPHYIIELAKSDYPSDLEFFTYSYVNLS